MEKTNQTKKNKNLFKTTVRQCLSQDVLTDKRFRNFSKRARLYICTYHVLHEQMIKECKNDDDNTAVPVKIEALAKQFKAHCCALDFNHAFIKTVL